MKHLKLSLVFTFIGAFLLGVFFTASNIVYGLETNTNTGTTITTCTNPEVRPIIISPADNTIISADTNITVKAPCQAIGISINVVQFEPTFVRRDEYHFMKEGVNWVERDANNPTGIIYYPQDNKFIGKINFPKYINEQAKIEAWAGFASIPATTDDSFVNIKKLENNTGTGSNTTPTTTTPTTTTPTTTTPSPTTLEEGKTYTTSETTAYYNNQYSSTDPSVYEKPPATSDQFWNLPKEEQKNIVIEYLKKNLPGSVVNEHIDNEKVLKMIASPTAENVKAENANVKFEDNKPKIELKGKAEPNSNVELYIFSDPLVVTTKADSNGDWVYVLDQGIAEGKHEVFVTVTDNSGNVTKRSNPLTFFLNTAEAAKAAGTTVETKQNFYETSLFKYSVVSGIIMLVVLFTFFALLRYEKRKITKELTAKS